MKIVGVAGTIGSGKSLICKILTNFNGIHFNSDIVAKKIMETSPQLKEQIIQNFGENSYLPIGKLNTSYLQNVVFSNSENVYKINSLVHPYVFKEFENWIQKFYYYDLIIAESGIMFASGFYKKVNFIIGVISPLNNQIERIKKRSNIPTDLIYKIMSFQDSQETIIKNANFIVRNDGKSELISQILAVIKHIKNL